MSKLISLSAAVQQYVHDGDLVYAAGFTHLIPFAAGHEIIRQKRRNLVLARATPDLIYDQLVAAGCARQVIFSYMGNPGVARCASCALSWRPGGWSGMNTRTSA
jgi:glutaconate CoA-transferase subunit A